jgi:hypothetical protein
MNQSERQLTSVLNTDTHPSRLLPFLALFSIEELEARSCGVDPVFSFWNPSLCHIVLLPKKGGPEWASCRSSESRWSLARCCSADDSFLQTKMRNGTCGIGDSVRPRREDAPNRAAPDLHMSVFLLRSAARVGSRPAAYNWRRGHYTV